MEPSSSPDMHYKYPYLVGLVVLLLWHNSIHLVDFFFFRLYRPVLRSYPVS